ncbi:hypothetical protein NDU88_000924 [Pleurodeles waltl]|uniref:Uncharacterized protein n=1 Tax=Pleurodeles waltl TaxID=8319 RepID=A0AAV7S740_PLEWA|nr:hypothetical protein NDU88_000924 [Pleurodeles waltl]
MNSLPPGGCIHVTPSREHPEAQTGSISDGSITRLRLTATSVEEGDVGDHQDDLEKMLAHMRAEALKQGKDWLRAKMEERVADGDVSQVSDQNLTTREDASGPGSKVDPTHKANKRQRTEGKPAKKVAKRSKGGEPAYLSTSNGRSTRKQEFVETIGG